MQKFDSILYWNTEQEKRIPLYMSCSNAKFYTPVEGKLEISSKIAFAFVLWLLETYPKHLKCHTHKGILYSSISNSKVLGKNPKYLSKTTD